MLCLRICAIALLLAASVNAATPWAFRPPAVPLVTHDPYFSIWSMSDRLTDQWPRHWTGANHGLFGAIRIDGQWHRFLGDNPASNVKIPTLEQTDLAVLPTRTIARFEGNGIRMDVTFTSPLLPAELPVLARPISYIAFEVRSIDGKSHAASIYFDACAEIAVNSVDQSISMSRTQANRIAVLRAGTVDQKILGRKGDGVRIDWGHLYLAAPQATFTEIGRAQESRPDCVVPCGPAGPLPDQSLVVKDEWPVLVCRYDLAAIGDAPVERHVMLGYDEIDAVEYLGQKLAPYWHHEAGEFGELLVHAERDYDRVTKLCRAFDRALMTDLTRAGGEKYAQLAALAYREAFAGHGLALSSGGRPFMFAKENSSNGCIGTVDVIYPAAPIFLLLSPTLMEANLAPVMEYADSPRWKFPFAPHDLGTYPLANGQVYGGGEKTEKNQMPVEESGNMLLLVAAMEKATGTPSQLAQQHRALLRKWADYLVEKGLDPENQLCTDDFAGHLAHNVNLSAKAILAIAAYAQICDNHADREEGRKYREQAQQMAKQWMTMAADGDHTRLAFDKPGTWSQKYNLVWDKVLGLDLFLKELASTEISFYKTKLNKYGVPLDGREKYAKVDWTLWSASLADNQADFEALVDPVYGFANATIHRDPLSDWYMTDTANNRSFRARPVIGGVFMKLLCDPDVWKKWSAAPTP